MSFERNEAPAELPVEEAGERDLIERALSRDPHAIRSIMRKHNERLFRIARSVLRDDDDAEELLQDAYLHAFAHLRELRDDSTLSTWLSRIVIGEALDRLGKREASTVPAIEIAGQIDAALPDAFPLHAHRSEQMIERVLRRLPLNVLDEAMIKTVVHGFYDKIRQDDLLAPIFNRAIGSEEWPRHLAKMCDFWSSMLLRTGRYGGRPLPPHIAVPGLREEHFRRWLTLFRSTVRELCPPDVASLFMDRALRVAQSFRLAIAAVRGENSLEVRAILEESL